MENLEHEEYTQVGSKWKYLQLTISSLPVQRFAGKISASGSADRMFTPTTKQQFIISPAQSLMKLNPTVCLKPCALSMLHFKFGFSAKLEKQKTLHKILFSK